MKLSDIDIVLFDLDGTVYYGPNIIPGANETIDYFRKNNKKVFFTTNNSTKTRRQIYERLVNMGIDCHLKEVLTSGYLAALYAKRYDLHNIYIFGSSNLIEEFNEMNISVDQNTTAENLLIGFNPLMTYDDLTSALQVALHAKCILACNKERTYPGENAKLMPGCGAMTAPIEWCAKRECDIIIGKPNTLMVDLLSEMENVKTNRFLVIGDTYESDIAMANKAGCYSILINKEKYIGTTQVETIKNVPSIIE